MHFCFNYTIYDLDLACVCEYTEEWYQDNECLMTFVSAHLGDADLTELIDSYAKSKIEDAAWEAYSK
jgi:hypothetical protein